MLAPLLLLALAASADPGAAAPTLRLTSAEMFRLAEAASKKGDTATADAVYAALESNPDGDIRAEARFRQAKQFIARKRNRDAALLLRRILDEKPDAAPVRLQLAQLLQSMGDIDGAWRQLRAAQASGLPTAVARIVDRYSEALRASRPMGASFEIAIAPDSNINHATRSDRLGTIFGDFDIGEDSKAKSGTGIAVRSQAYRRFAIGGDDTSLLVRLSGSGDLYRQASFNDIAFDLAAGPEVRFGSNRLNLELGATQRWYGQKPFVRSVRAGATLVRPIGRLAQLRLGASAALLDNSLNDLQDGRTYSAQLSLERAITPTTGVALTLSGDRQALKDPGYSTWGWRAGLVGWKDLGRVTLTAGAEFGRLKADERLLLFPEKRSEQYSRFSLGASFRQLGVLGFAPQVRFSVERNRSTIEFYDYSRTRTEFGLVRAF